MQNRYQPATGKLNDANPPRVTTNINNKTILNRGEVEQKMRERGFTVYATVRSANSTKLQFVSAHMYDMAVYQQNTPPREQVPVFNILVDLEKDEFSCIYNVSGSINTLNSSACGPVMDDEHFDKIVGKFELHAKWLSRLTN